MATFQKIVMISATIILIIALSFIGLALYRQKYKADFPPVIANCPDYWIDSSGNGKACNLDSNPNNQVGTCKGPMDFTAPQWSGTGTGDCAKFKWAKSCNLSWDGITNNADICGGDESGESDERSGGFSSYG
jgi:hypothetical protein